MAHRRGIGTGVVGLVALVAILGTTVYFMSGYSFINQKSNEQGQQSNSQNSQNTQYKTETTTNTVTQPTTSPPVSSQTQTHVCSGSSIQVKNVHTWVSSNSQTVTAFAIQNNGCSTNIDSIALRGISVPLSNWYSCGSSCGSSTNMNTVLTPDYNPENGVNLASGMTSFNLGHISLGEGQSTIVYLKDAGSIQPIDAGNTYALQIQAGLASAVQQVQVVSVNT